MVQDMTYHHRLSYSAAPNKTRLPQTPGNRIVYLYTKKVWKAPKSTCDACSGRLRGVCAVRPAVSVRLSKTKKHVSLWWFRVCQICARQDQQAFHIEEQKNVVKMLKTQHRGRKQNKYAACISN
ncbi:large ribosomal subunit protein eL34-like [Meriones unguiculatus]|uniref:large ribosomal subunit protein eL34-like n=1 Tax=Meriones unguiculatus TaxID=10047 RepID=UPI00293F76A0|nr:large ribosomal subunit protein eL34-like [Meriones unguiculatus]